MVVGNRSTVSSKVGNGTKRLRTAGIDNMFISTKPTCNYKFPKNEILNEYIYIRPGGWIFVLFGPWPERW